ncbi:LLM class F420-dependent oxidoreductase [Gryllotalpicola sp.]|uniref:LLM class F420-dependent oxidoreductase n=1 Tax=Gryllotalpicola sp. TaxID=1932787 RepID=UPI0026194ACC|nr:LLM class F420-dependent oxidoreductase [Gryllotalpicola sp.]
MTIPALGKIGVWRSGRLLTPELAQHLERLGFGAIWIGGSPSANLEFPEQLLDATERITIATAIVNIWTSDPLDLAVAFHRVDQKHPGRFVLGIGAGHPEQLGGRSYTPYQRMVDYLDWLDLERVPLEQRVLAALGPRMLKLAAERAAGAHPYLMTAEFDARARTILDEARGEGERAALLVPEQRVVLRQDAEEARRIAHPHIERYLALANYTKNLRELGFTDQDLTAPGSDHLIDELVVYGQDEDIQAGIQAHFDAGADHVAVQLLTGHDDLVDISFTRLAHILMTTAEES